MSKLAFIFPGQGAQKAGMGKDFYENSEAARSFFDHAQEILDCDLKEMCFGEHEELNLTEYTPMYGKRLPCNCAGTKKTWN